MDSLFFDILGALIGFVTVLLLLSMIVTAMVQVTQALLRLRGRNLLFGLTSVIAKETTLSYRSAKAKARDILYDKEAPTLGGGMVAPSTVGKFFGPQISWLEVEDLRRILGNCALGEDEDVNQKIVARFDQTQKALQKRFLRNMRLWTIVWSLPVAFYFQVSAPVVLNEFLTDPELRDRALRMQPELQAEVQASLGRAVSYEEVSARTLERLVEKYPQHRELLEEVSGVGDSKGDIVTELADVVKEVPEGNDMVKEYQRLLDAHYQAELDTALEEAGVSVQRLGQFNIEPWRDDWDFYMRGDQPRWNNWVGVFMTTILLSFGAPFWYNMLRNLMNLRDTLKPPEKDSDKTGSGKQGSGESANTPNSNTSANNNEAKDSGKDTSTANKDTT